MNKSDELITLLQDNELTRQALRLKNQLLEQPELLSRYQELIQLQKKMVIADQSGESARFLNARSAYESKMALLMDNPIVAEYVNCCEELAQLTGEITEILNDGIKINRK